jgi:hypothetical protein
MIARRRKNGYDQFPQKYQATIAANEDHVGAGIGGRERHLPPKPATAAGDEKTLSSQSESVEDAHRFRHSVTSQCG